MRIESDIKLDFKDVLIRPKRSTLKSRSEVCMLYACVRAAVACGCRPIGLEFRVVLESLAANCFGFFSPYPASFLL